MKKILPSFFNDEAKGYDELLVDYWMSWTIRCAGIPDSNKEYEKVRESSKKILSFCLTKKENAEFLNGKNIKDIKCWKEHSIDDGKIDLWFELKIDNKNYALIFENKVNAQIGKGQLEKYKSSIDEHYKGKNFTVIYILLRANDDSKKDDEKLCEDNDFVHIFYWELQDIINNEPTGNDLFDEFWINW